MPWFSVSLLAWGTEMVLTVSGGQEAHGRAVEGIICQSA